MADYTDQKVIEEAVALLQLRLDEANALIDDLLRRVARLSAENEALWEERGRP